MTTYVPDHLYWAEHYFKQMTRDHPSVRSSIKIAKMRHAHYEQRMYFAILLQTEYEYDAANKRYCDIKATNLDEILQTCERHIKNITATRLDLIEEKDITQTDEFYINMFLDTWTDLRDDVKEIINQLNSSTEPKSKVKSKLPRN